jgi:hypothetical protein
MRWYELDDNGYYIGRFARKQPGKNLVQLPDQPSPFHDRWDGTQWVENTVKRDYEGSKEKIIDESFPADGVKRVLFEAIFELANRVKALEDGGSYTRAQVKNWLKAKLP